MRHALPVEAGLGVRTAFNLLGPLTNPAAARRQLVGVPHSELTELLARALAAPGIGTRVGRARSGRDRRVVDDRAHKSIRVPERHGLDVLRAPVGFRDVESGTP